jgi:hypothetical protein
MVIVMVWIYYSAQIFLLGAEFTWVSRTRGIAPGRAAAESQSRRGDDARAARFRRSAAVAAPPARSHSSSGGGRAIRKTHLYALQRKGCSARRRAALSSAEPCCDPDPR